MNANSVGMATRKRVTAEAFQLLTSQTLPNVQEFIHYANELRGTNILIGGLERDVHERIHNHIRELNPKLVLPGNQILAEDLLNFVDTKRENGKQHIFLFKLSDQHLDYLQELRKPEFHKQLLTKNKLPNCFNAPQILWETRSPQLAAIQLDLRERQTLTYKWVDTRVNRQLVDAGKDEQGREIKVQVNTKNRTVAYFRIHLENGTSELCIPEFETNAQSAILEEREQYCTLLRNLIQFDYFHIQSLEPTVRSLLINPRSVGNVTGWKISYPNGGTLRGGGDPGLFQWLGILWKPFIGEHLDIRWNNRFRVRLDAETDDFELRDFASREEETAILEDAWSVIKDTIEDPYLKELADKNVKQRSLIKKFDILLTQCQKETIDCNREISARYGASIEDVFEILDQLNGLFPNNFKSQFMITCPDSGKVILAEDGNPLTFDKSIDIPKRVHCTDKRHKLQKVSHPTRDNIKPTLIYVRPLASMVSSGIGSVAERPHGLIDRLERAFGRVVSRQIIKTTFLFLFAVLYIGLAYGVLRLFLPLVQQYTGEDIYIVLVFLIVLVQFIGLLISLFGTKTINGAIKVLGALITSATDLVPFFRKKIRK